MTLEPLLSAAPAVQAHAAAALVAFALGAVQLVAPKGTGAHKLLGYVWVGLLGLVAASSLFIHELRLVGPWSPIHLLSLWTLGVLPYAVWLARRGAIESHRRAMISLYAGALLIAGLFTLLPGRIMHAVVLGP